MADVLIHHANKVLLLAGSYHTSKKIGIPLHIQDFKSSKKIVVVNLNYGEIDLKDSDYVLIYKKKGGGGNEKIKFILCYGFMFC